MTKIDLNPLSELISQYEMLKSCTGINSTQILLNQEKLIKTEQARIIKATEAFDVKQAEYNGPVLNTDEES